MTAVRELRMKGFLVLERTREVIDMGELYHLERRGGRGGGSVDGEMRAGELIDWSEEFQAITIILSESGNDTV
jgi:hypothetical protein